MIAKKLLLPRKSAARELSRLVCCWLITQNSVLKKCTRAWQGQRWDIKWCECDDACKLVSVHTWFKHETWERQGGDNHTTHGLKHCCLMTEGCPSLVNEVKLLSSSQNKSKIAELRTGTGTNSSLTSFIGDGHYKGWALLSLNSGVSDSVVCGCPPPCCSLVSGLNHVWGIKSVS